MKLSTRSFFEALAVTAAAFGLSACGDAPTSARAADDAPAASAEVIALEQRLAELERRRIALEDENAIKRLQRAYGYYVDQGLWDEAADLFAANGSIEIALDGVYIGQDRVREYLRTLGNGRTGLAEGELIEHLQLMPFVTLSADGLAAKARWRSVQLLGRLGEFAHWGEGPYENEYIKEDGVWKIGKLHWFQSIVVPYEGGWAKNEDANGGRYVADRLPPDAPPTFEYATWPSTFLPPFHFENPASGPSAVRAARAARAGGQAGQDDAMADGNSQSPDTAGHVAQDRPAALARRAAVLAHEVGVLEDQLAIENLQRTYGFYIEEGLWSEAASLFAGDATYEIAGVGVHEGRERILDHLRAIDVEYPREGRLYDRMQLQPIVHVAPDRQSANGRWHLFAQEADHGEFAEWGVGWYENEYVKEDGVWKIANVTLFERMYTPYEEGWGETALERPSFASQAAPDRPSQIAHAPYPASPETPAFHYENPVTGEPVFRNVAAALAPELAATGLDGVQAALDEAERRLGLLEDTAAIERLHSAYGYYLARNQWDNLAGIFADDGTIEIAQRGVYVGKASVRRNLNLYGDPGVHHGVQHNHMQYQPVIHVAPDGRTANMRSRAFSIMGNHEQLGSFMGGVYENTFVKEDGVWKIATDQVFNTYFAPYDVGWKELNRRNPPGLTEANPPDLPPSMPFEMYPSSFLPPFHYDNPVTGQPVQAAAGG